MPSSSSRSSQSGWVAEDTWLLFGYSGRASGSAARKAWFELALIAAFSMVAKEGWTPQARQEGIGKLAFAVRGSKFEGTGFANEHIGQIQVPLDLGIVRYTSVDLVGLFDRVVGED